MKPYVLHGNKIYMENKGKSNEKKKGYLKEQPANPKHLESRNKDNGKRKHQTLPKAPMDSKQRREEMLKAAHLHQYALV